MIRLDTHKKSGFVITWPYHPDPSVRNAIINRAKQCAGFSFNKPLGGWVSEGPEVILDIDRSELWPYITQITPEAQERVANFRIRLELILEAKHKEHTEEYGYQKNGCDALALQERGLLADSMGLGKSKQALDACAKLGLKKILVLAPKTLTYNWANEIDKWYPQWNVTIIGDTLKARNQSWAEQPKDSWPQVIIANYEKTILKDWPFDITWDVVIPDECHRLKNTSTKTHKAVKKIKADRMWGLSGTPLEMRVEELYGIMSILRPSVFGGYLRFRDQHIITDAYGRVLAPRNLELLKERIAPWMTRRRKEDVLKQLPPKLYNNLFVEMNAGEQAEYKLIKNDFLAWLAENQYNMNSANAMVQLLRLQQFTCSPVLLEEEAPHRGTKFESLEEIVQEWDGQIMVFTRFAKMANYLLNWLGCNPAALIAGEVPGPDRVSRVAAFNAGQLGKVLVSTDAGAYGLNVTGANLIIHYDQLWNPGKMWQREDRLHRIGQKDTVNVLNLINQNTVDEGMMKVLEKRRELFKDVIDGAEDASIQKIGSATLKKIVEGNI